MYRRRCQQTECESAGTESRKFITEITFTRVSGLSLRQVRGAGADIAPGNTNISGSFLASGGLTTRLGLTLIGSEL
jgi:hypothetical protein